jgi:23S rRNA (uracil1939-C5)-methyltransferase
MKVTIEKLDNFGKGITHFDNKVIFIPKTLPMDECEIEIVKEKKNYSEGKLIKIIKQSKDRIESKCPYFNECGGCALQNLDYDNTVKFKQNKIKELFLRNNIEVDNINFISNERKFNYRNKIELKIVNKKIGYFEELSHKLIEIDRCLIAKDKINEVINEVKKLNIVNGEITIRCNFNDEILLIINTENKININEIIMDRKIVGIILNNNIIYGEDYFVEKVNSLYFKVSYNSFFQINEWIFPTIFKEIQDNINKEDVVLDLYCGVGTISLHSAVNAKEVIGVEIVKNAVLNAIKNKEINGINNVEFLLQDLSKGFILDKSFNTIIVDPPRNGIDKKTMDYILCKLPNKVIYMSCDANTLVRDLKILCNYYDIIKCNLYDMFSYTYHVESLCVLKIRKS